jgi:hypothetical protein
LGGQNLRPGKRVPMAHGRCRGTPTTTHMLSLFLVSRVTPGAQSSGAASRGMPLDRSPARPPTPSPAGDVTEAAGGPGMSSSRTWFFCQIVCDRAVSSAALLCWPCALYCLHVGIEERDLTGHWSRKCLISCLIL